MAFITSIWNLDRIVVASDRRRSMTGVVMVDANQMLAPGLRKSDTEQKTFLCANGAAISGDFSYKPTELAFPVDRIRAEILPRIEETSSVADVMRLLKAGFRTVRQGALGFLVSGFETVEGRRELVVLRYDVETGAVESLAKESSGIAYLGNAEVAERLYGEVELCSEGESSPRRGLDALTIRTFTPKEMEEFGRHLVEVTGMTRTFISSDHEESVDADVLEITPNGARWL